MVSPPSRLSAHHAELELASLLAVLVEHVPVGLIIVGVGEAKRALLISTLFTAHLQYLPQQQPFDNGMQLHWNVPA